MSFWILAFVVAGLVAALVVLVMGRGRPAAAPAGRNDMQVYRDQLKEIDRDTARGVISQEEAARVRLEVSRRLLEADSEARNNVAAGASEGSLVGGLLVGAALIGAAFFLYFQLGAIDQNGQPLRDLPLKTRIENTEAARAARPAQAVVEEQMGAAQIDPNAEPRMITLMQQLREALKQRPNDLQGHILLARNEAVLGDFVASHRAQTRVIELKGNSATATDYADLADMMILAAGGYVSPEAETALTRSLHLDPDNGTARYYSGQMFAQSGRPDLAFRIWRSLLESSDPDDPWVRPIREQIELAAADAGVRYTLPPLPGLKGPDAADVQAASEMTEEERAGMIRGMVEGLSDRLATTGGTPEEWARLIGALGVLGEAERAKAIWEEAQTVFAGNPEVLDTIRAAALRAGVAR